MLITGSQRLDCPHHTLSTSLALFLRQAARDRDPSRCRSVPPGVALMPEDFPRRLAALKKLTGLTWEGMADALGVDPRQLLRWRKRHGEPNGGAMLSLVRLAARVPGGLELLLYGDYSAIQLARR